jgi:quinol monooxygenase YgiN
MFELEILFRIYPEKRAEFLMAFELMKSAERLEKKRTGLELFELVRESNTFLWLEQWSDAESLAYYCNENKFRATMGAIDILGKLIHRRTLTIEEETANEQPV